MIATLTLLISLVSASENMESCQQRYQAAGASFAITRDNISLIPDARGDSVLSYDGREMIGYDRTRFVNKKGTLATTVQEVMSATESDALNAALVYEFLRAADNDSDYPVVQLMALQLQPKYPNVRLDFAIHAAITFLIQTNEIPPFCAGSKLWTWKEIQDWLELKAIPEVLKKKPFLAKSGPVCQQIGSVLHCASE